MNDVPAEGRLRIVTLNLWGSNEWAARRDEVCSWLEDLQPDVVGLQEVTRTRKDAPAQWLADQLDLRLAYGSIPHADGSEFGNATLSRYSILDVESQMLPTLDGKREQRLCLRATLDSPRGPIEVYNTHLSHLFDEGFVREAQVVALSHFIDQTSRAACPPILVGDFNAVPAAAEIRYLKGLNTLNGLSFHLFDTYEVANPLVPGFTWDNRNSWAARNRVPDQRIDYVFAGVRADDGTGQVLASKVVFDQARSGTWASDHFGVLTDLRFVTA